MVDMVKRTQKIFLDSQKKQMQDLLEKELENLTNEWPEIKPRICDEMLTRLCSLYESYSEHQSKGIIQQVCYIQFSFLRTGLMDQSAWCRINLYDKNWYASGQDCYVDWTPSYISDKIYRIKETLLKNFKKQTGAPEYFLDDLIFLVTEEFIKELLTTLQAVMEELLKNEIFQAAYGKNIKVYGGEFLDQCWLLHKGGNV